MIFLKMKGIMIALIIFLLAGCQSKTLEEVLEDEVSQKVVEVIDTKEWEDKKIVLYLTKEDYKWIKVGLLEKKSGKWNLTHSTGHSLADQPLLARHSSWFTYEANELDVIYGMVKDKDIRSIEVKKDNGFQEIPIHETEAGRFFYSPYSWGPVKALDREGTVIYEEDFRG